MKRKNVWLYIVIMVIGVAYFIGSTFSLESHIRIIVRNESGGTIEGAHIAYFYKRLMIPTLGDGDRYENKIDITNEGGESSITFSYPDMQQPTVFLSSYVEGGRTGLYRGKIIITIEKNGQVDVDVRRYPISIL